MVTFRTSCRRCGDVDVPKTEFALDPAGRYRFRCSICRETQEHEAGPSVTMLLGAAGVRTARLDPITEDEIDRFAAGLKREGWFEALQSLVTGDQE